MTSPLLTHFRDYPLYTCEQRFTMEESISLEETNKIRISLGLKPLVDDGKVGDDKEKQAEDNYANQRQKEIQAKESK